MDVNHVLNLCGKRQLYVGKRFYGHLSLFYFCLMIFKLTSVQIGKTILAWLTLVLMCIHDNAYAQQSLDYIQDLAKAKTAGDSADNYAWASINTLREDDTSHTFIYAREAMRLSSKSEDYTHSAVASFALSYAHFVFDNNDSAKHYAHKVIENYDLSGKKGVYYTYALNTISGYYLNIGDAEQALEYGHKQLETAIELKDTVSISNSYTMLCAIYEMQNNIPEAIKYAQKALQLNEQTNNIINRTIVLSNMASLLLKANQPQEALSYCHQSIYYGDIAFKAVRNVAITFMLAGECHTQLNNFDSAKYYLRKADRYIENIASPQSKVKLWMLYANAFRATDNYQKAIDYLDKAIQLAKESNLLKLYSEALKSHSTFSAKVGNYQDAYTYLKGYNEINDSLTNTNIQSTVANLREKYESDKKDERIAQQKRDNKLLTFGIAIVFIFTILILTQYLQQRRANKTIQQQSEKLTFLMKELHHRVKNNLQIISSLLSLQSFRIKDSTASKAVREGQQRIEAMSMIHQRLYTRENITEINIKEFITDLVDSLQNAYGFGQNDITINLDIDNELMNVDQAIPLSLIINELVTNAFKYAYDDNNNPKLTINLNRKGNDLKIKVADNGKGLNIEKWEGKDGSFGKELIQTFVQQLNGYLDLIVNNGTEFTLTIPYSA